MPAGGVYTFASSIEEAADVALRLAGGQDVDVFSASIGTQLLRAGFVDEIRVHLVPVLLGAGTRLLDDTSGHVHLEPTDVVQGARAIHLRYRVVKSA